MKYTRIGLAALLLLMWQTVVSHWLFPEYQHYDALLLLMVYAGLYESRFDAALCAIFAGLMMDNLSGEPFGFYTSFYLWSIILIRISATYLYVLNRLLPTFLVGGLIFLEHGISWLAWEDAGVSFFTGRLIFHEAQALLTSWWMLEIFRRALQAAPSPEAALPTQRA